MLASHIALEQLADLLPATGAPLALWQIKVMTAFYDWLEDQEMGGAHNELLQRRLVSRELLTSISCRIHHQLEAAEGELSSVLVRPYSFRSYCEESENVLE